MVNLAAMVWRRLLRKRWVLALVFGLSLVYFLSSTFKQVSGCPPPSHLCSPGRLVSPGLGGTPSAAALPVCPRVRCAGTEDGRRDLPISLVPGREGAARLGVQVGLEPRCVGP